MVRRTLKDRRRRGNLPIMAPTQPPRSDAKAEQPQDHAATAAAGGRAEEAALPPVDFQTLVISLGSSVLLHLGMVPDVEGGAPTVDLSLAKHSIDVLAMLQEKTRGNLTEAEADLLQGLLYDLRLKYIEAKRK